MHSVADWPLGVFPYLGGIKMSCNSGVIPMDEEDRQMIDQEIRWIEFQKAKNSICNELTTLSGDCLHHAKQVADDYLEDAVAEIRDHLLNDVKRIIKSLEGLADERP
jgi:hypothetical protein